MYTSPPRRTRRRWLPFAAIVLLCGCENGELSIEPLVNLFEEKPPAEEAPKPRDALRREAVAAGTIGEQVLLADVSPVTLRGFGLVVGLDGAGSRDVPTSVRDYLVDFLAKQIAIEGQPRPKISPGELIDSPDTAVVEISGEAPPGSPAGTRFDLRVRALPGTSTTSLSGGLLLPAEMRIFDVAASGEGMFYGKPLAEAGGPVVTSPFADESDAAPDSDPRIASVFGGGRTIEGRVIRLTLTRPDYATARRIERRINERFGQNPRVASAMSRGYVEVRTPPEYAAAPEHFQRLLAYLYFDTEPAAVERRLAALSEVVAGGDADLESISLSWEGIGKQAIPRLQEFYSHTDVRVRFHAARAGMKLRDTSAVPVMAQCAAEGEHGERLLAIRELGAYPAPQAAQRLRPLLSDRNEEIRIAAYEALVQHGSPAVRSRQYPHPLDPQQLNLCLDVVDAGGPPMIYVRRSRVPRIAVFGRQPTVDTPIFYTQPADDLTLVTSNGSNEVQVFMKRGGKLSQPVAAPPRVAELVEALAAPPARRERDRGALGMGLPYSRVVQVLADLSRDQVLNASLVFERATLTDLLGPRDIPDRLDGERADTIFDPAAAATDSPENAADAASERPTAPDRPAATGRAAPPERAVPGERDAKDDPILPPSSGRDRRDG